MTHREIYYIIIYEQSPATLWIEKGGTAFASNSDVIQPIGILCCVPCTNVGLRIVQDSGVAAEVGLPGTDGC